MNPNKIHDIMDLAQKIRRASPKEMFNPLFVGEAGLGKSQVVQQWVKKVQKDNPDFGFIDLRIAYMEAPDMIGLPDIKDGKTVHNIPSFWPTKGEGLILLEEPNRGTTGVMNTLMQVLTDRQIHQYRLPEGWMIAACMNPDSAEYDVHQMDTALKDRFVEYRVDYDHNTFVSFIESSEWSETIQLFIKSGTWVYKESKSIGKDGKYVSPRSWAPLNAAEKAGVKNNKMLHDEICRAQLGKDLGKEYWTFCHKQRPVMASDLLLNKEDALSRLSGQSAKDNYQGDMVSATIESVIKHYGGLDDKCPEDKIKESLMCEVALVIPSDQALNLIRGCCKAQKDLKDTEFYKHIAEKYPSLVSVLKSNIKLKKGP
jgi:hypothetical protein